MPSYCLCTSDGPTLLTEGLAAKLKLALEGAIARDSEKRLSDVSCGRIIVLTATSTL
jgi:hypothetical protein